MRRGPVGGWPFFARVPLPSLLPLSPPKRVLARCSAAGMGIAGPLWPTAGSTGCARQGERRCTFRTLPPEPFEPCARVRSPGSSERSGCSWRPVAARERSWTWARCPRNRPNSQRPRPPTTASHHLQQRPIASQRARHRSQPPPRRLRQRGRLPRPAPRDRRAAHLPNDGGAIGAGGDQTRTVRAGGKTAND